MCIIYLVRHGETDWNTQELVQGHTDIELSCSGKKQAEIRAEFFKEISFNAIYTSDLIRAKETAEILMKGMSLPITTTKLLREQSWGNWEGYSWNLLREKFGNDFSSYTGQDPHKVPGVESHYDVAKRVIPFLLDTGNAHPNKKLLVVSHGGVLKAIMYHLELSHLMKQRFENLGFIKLQISKGNIQFLEIHGTY